MAGGAKRAKDARKVLEKYKIGINDAKNGVFLSAYYEKVNKLLIDAQSKEDCEAILQYIKDNLF